MSTPRVEDPNTTPRRGSTSRRLATAATLGAAGLGLIATVGSLPSAEANHLLAGAAQIVNPSTGAPLSSGGSSTSFGVKLPTDDSATPTVNEAAACTGDSANAGYRIQSFLVPESVDLDTLKFNSSGPVPVANQVRQPLFFVAGESPLVDNQTATAVPVGGPGPIIQPLDDFNLAVFPPGFLTPGAYRIGIACTLGPPTSPSQLDKYWDTSITIAADSGDDPAQARWTVMAPPAITTRSNLGWMPVATVTAAALATGGVVVLRRRKTPRVAASNPFPPDSAKETR